MPHHAPLVVDGKVLACTNCLHRIVSTVLHVKTDCGGPIRVFLREKNLENVKISKMWTSGSIFKGNPIVISLNFSILKVRELTEAAAASAREAARPIPADKYVAYESFERFRSVIPIAVVQFDCF